MKWLITLTLLLGSAPTQAQNYIDITGATYSLVSIAPSESDHSLLVKRTLKILNHSGIFEVHSIHEASDLTISYNPYPDVAKMEISGIDGMVFYSKAILLPIVNLKAEAKSQASSIIQVLTGNRPKFKAAIAYVTHNQAEGYKLVMTDFLGERQQVISADGHVILLPRWNPRSNALTYTYLGNQGTQGAIQYIKKKRRFIRPKFGTILESIFTGTRNQIIVNLSLKGNADLYLYRLRSKSLTPITLRSSIETSPSLNANNQLLFVSDRSGSVQIYQKNLTSKFTWRMTFEGGYNAEPAWSPTGKFFAFSGSVNGSYQIFLMDDKGSSQHQLTFGSGSNEQPRFSPDGRQIVYVHKQAGVQKLYIMRIDGSFQHRLTQSPASIQEFNPDWSQQDVRWSN